MVTFIKWLVPVLTTALTISIGVFVAWKWMVAAEDGHGALGVVILYLVFILPLSFCIGVAGGVVWLVFVIPRILKEKPPPPKTPPQLICGKCNNKSTVFDALICPNCGEEFSTKTNDHDQFGLF